MKYLIYLNFEYLPMKMNWKKFSIEKNGIFRALEIMCIPEIIWP